MSVLSLGAPNDVQFGVGERPIVDFPLSDKIVTSLNAIVNKNMGTRDQINLAKSILQKYAVNKTMDLRVEMTRLRQSYSSEKVDVGRITYEKTLPDIPNPNSSGQVPSLKFPGTPGPVPAVLANKRADFLLEAANGSDLSSDMPESGEKPDGWMGKDDLTGELGKKIDSLTGWGEFAKVTTNVNSTIDNALAATTIPQQQNVAAKVQSAQLFASKLAADEIVKSMSRQITELQKQNSADDSESGKTIAELHENIDKLNRWLKNYGILSHRCMFLLKYMTREMNRHQFTEEQRNEIESITKPVIPICTELLYQILTTPNNREWSVAGTKLANFLDIQNSSFGSPEQIWHMVQQQITILVDKLAQRKEKDLDFILNEIANAPDSDKTLQG